MIKNLNYLIRLQSSYQDHHLYFIEYEFMQIDMEKRYVLCNGK